MSTGFTANELQKYIDRIAERLPKQIIVGGKTLDLYIKYFGNLDNSWTLSYSTDDPKDTFIQRTEFTLETCVLGAWRELALKKDEWQQVKEV